MSAKSTSFYNCRVCKNGKLVDENISFSNETGLFQDSNGYISTDAIDLQGKIIAPGFIELQTNGMRGFHFTHFDDEESYAKKLDEVARYLPSQGVTSFYVTIPTVASSDFQKILPSLKPRQIPSGASLLGAHAEGPYLHPSKKGAHNASLFHLPTTSPTEIYGPTAHDSSTLKLITLAPELPDSGPLITHLTAQNIKVSLGHSSATYTTGLAALAAGATCLTHTLNAMAPLHHRDPGLAGLITTLEQPPPPSPYFSIIPDGHHLHPSITTLLFRANPTKCILITDSIELAGLPDGTYPGHAQIPHKQTKIGSRCVRNLVGWSGCGVAEAVRCVTENVVGFMGDEGRGALEVGRRADFVVLDHGGDLLETWVGGVKVWGRERVE
ncbi:carbohydrate esterase family 9 protein [Zasmidium cellare ATCC 36951]|uniref:N-acetylglucosamine-6-phosphate deacetylase n=1 Tax=Zasmidium cellare ATCC 36951 TaxID=1080233 RepID=A0A6A6CZA6_ZASCE|nr:carbohydrate esterase family 9 protein [Zasmidium cellare ATCC 36951]KAF2171222.1 carbohydrate esterase family 9 protein [Zasmidium cellare ATCC 36951]